MTFVMSIALIELASDEMIELYRMSIEEGIAAEEARLKEERRIEGEKKLNALIFQRKQEQIRSVETRKKVYSGKGISIEFSSKIQKLYPYLKFATIAMKDIIHEDLYFSATFDWGEKKDITGSIVGVDLARNEVIVFWENEKGIGVSACLPSERQIDWKMCLVPRSIESRSKASEVSNSV